MLLDPFHPVSSPVPTLAQVKPLVELKTGLCVCVCVMIGCLLAAPPSVLKDKANSPACVLFEKKRRKSVLTLLSACDPPFLALTWSIKQMSAGTNQKNKSDWPLFKSG